MSMSEMINDELVNLWLIDIKFSNSYQIVINLASLLLVLQRQLSYQECRNSQKKMRL